MIQYLFQRSKKTYAEMSLEEKNIVSHRSLAIKKLKKFLLNLI